MAPEHQAFHVRPTIEEDDVPVKDLGEAPKDWRNWGMDMGQFDEIQ